MGQVQVPGDSKGGADGAEDIYKMEEFRMWCMKVVPCSKRYAHSWGECPFAHEGEKAARRDPRTYAYTGIACPDMKQKSYCPRRERCPYAHNAFEYWLHPTRYRMQLCRDGPACCRAVCFFAHSLDELRRPACKPYVSPEALARASLEAVRADPHPLDALCPSPHAGFSNQASRSPLRSPPRSPEGFERRRPTADGSSPARSSCMVVGLPRASSNEAIASCLAGGLTSAGHSGTGAWLPAALCGDQSEGDQTMGSAAQAEARPGSPSLASGIAELRSLAASPTNLLRISSGSSLNLGDAAGAGLVAAPGHGLAGTAAVDLATLTYLLGSGALSGVAGGSPMLGHVSAAYLGSSSAPDLCLAGSLDARLRGVAGIGLEGTAGSPDSASVGGATGHIQPGGAVCLGSTNANGLASSLSSVGPPTPFPDGLEPAWTDGIDAELAAALAHLKAVLAQRQLVQQLGSNC